MIPYSDSPFQAGVDESLINDKDLVQPVSISKLKEHSFPLPFEIQA